MNILSDMKVRPRRAILLGLAACLLAGCQGAPTRAPSQPAQVKGKVTLDGQPLADAIVTFFMPTGAVFSGATDSAGNYQLWSSLGGEQTCAGHCKVTISKYVLPAGTTPEPGVSPLMQGGKQLLPPKYADDEMTQLSADVPDQGGSFDFALTG